MSPAKRLRRTLAALLGASGALLMLMLAVQDAGTLRQARALSQRLDEADHERLEALVAEKASQVLRPLSVLADGRRGELLDQLKALSDQGALRTALAPEAKARPRKGKAPALKPAANPQAALRSVAGLAPGWGRLLLVNLSGKVTAVWPPAAAGAPSELGADLSGDPLVKALKQPGQAPGLPLHAYSRSPEAAAKGDHTGAWLRAACGVDSGSGVISGILMGRADARLALLGPDPAGLAGLIKTNPGAAALLLRGNGDEIWHSAKPAFSENLGAISADYKAVLAATVKDGVGRLSVASYDGKPGVLVWQRVGAVVAHALPEEVLSLAVFVPQAAFSTGAAASVEKPRPWYLRPWVLALLLLALALPLGLGGALLPGVLEPYHATAEQARRVEDYSPVPELMLSDEPDADAQAINRALAVLAKRARQGEERVRELDAALRRIEDQASRDATGAAQELSSLREKLGVTAAARQATDAKFDAAQKARQEAEAQLGNLRSALETATRNTELKAAENRNLSAQAQDLMRAMEEQRRVAEKAQENLAKKDSEVVRLAAVNTLSGELKATLSVIKNYISTMLGSQGAISDAQQEFLGVVINKSARLERLIGDLVELSEIGSGVKPLRLEAVAPSALVQEALVNARPQAEHKKISLELAEGGSLSPVQVDREKMGAVLRSLLSQAIKVTSRNEKIVLLLSEREQAVELRVTDPGMSLPPDRSAKVFNQFHGVDSQAGPEFIGTGLRFPILKSVVEAHGGKIWIESQVGRGKTFVVSMPKAGSVAASEPVPLSAAPALGAKALPPPALAGLPALPPPPAPKPSLPPPGLPQAPPLPPAPAVESSKVVSAPPVVHKPAPVDETLNSPWKRKDDSGLDTLEETMELPPPAPKPVAALPSLPPLPGPAGPSLGVLPLPAKPLLKTDAKPTESDTKDFDKVFGALPVQAVEQKGGVPKVDLKTDAKPDDKDLAQFAAIFGDVPKAPPGLGAPPPPASVKATPAVTADLDAIFGAPGTPPPAAKAPSPGVSVPPPPSADFDAIFGAPSAPPAPADGGLNTMDDLDRLLGN